MLMYYIKLTGFCQIQVALNAGLPCSVIGQNESMAVNINSGLGSVDLPWFLKSVSILSKPTVFNHSGFITDPNPQVLGTVGLVNK